MINLEKIKKEKCQPPFLRRPAPALYFHPFFLIFQIPHPPGEVIKIYFPKGEGVQTMHHDIFFCWAYCKHKIRLTLKKHYAYKKECNNQAVKSKYLLHLIVTISSLDLKTREFISISSVAREYFRSLYWFWVHHNVGTKYIFCLKIKNRFYNFFLKKNAKTAQHPPIIQKNSTKYD